MSEPIIRAYKCKDADMLTVCGTIAQQAITNKAALIAIRPGWADPFLPNIKTRIQNAFTGYLGIDNASEMRKATQVVNNLLSEALDNLSLFNVQVKADFQSNTAQLNNMLTSLGFVQHYKGAYKKNQQDLIELLYKFKTNMTAGLKTQITTAGTSPALIEDIIAHADTLKNANITQETLKGGRKKISEDGVIEFNAIYNSVISIAKISASIFKNDPAIRDQFNFTKTLKALTGSTTSNGGSSSGTSTGTGNQTGDNEITPVNP